jgi:hypothetical protein
LRLIPQNESRGTQARKIAAGTNGEHSHFQKGYSVLEMPSNEEVTTTMTEEDDDSKHVDITPRKADNLARNFLQVTGYLENVWIGTAEPTSISVSRGKVVNGTLT